MPLRGPAWPGWEGTQERDPHALKSCLKESATELSQARNLGLSLQGGKRRQFAGNSGRCIFASGGSAGSTLSPAHGKQTEVAPGPGCKGTHGAVSIFHGGNLHGHVRHGVKIERRGCQTPRGQGLLSAAPRSQTITCLLPSRPSSNRFQLCWLLQSLQPLLVWPPCPLPLVQEKLSIALKSPPQDLGILSRSLTTASISSSGAGFPHRGEAGTGRGSGALHSALLADLFSLPPTTQRR